MEKAIRFSIENKQFVRALKTATKVINRKTALPILGDVKLTMQDGTLTMTSGNSEAFITQPLADFAMLDGPKGWSLCCSPAMLISALGEIGDRSLVIDVTADNVMQVQYTLTEQTAGKFSLPVEEAAEYPTPQAVQAIDGVEPTEFRLPSSWLLKELSNARQSVASDELRPVMNSVCLDADREGLFLVASDGHTLYSTRYEWGLGNPEGPFIRSGEPRRVLIDKQMFGAISDAFSQDGEVTVRCDGNHVEVSGDGTVINCVCCTANYPNWQSVIPQQMPHRIVVEMRALLSALRRVQPFTNDSSLMVRLAIEGQMLTVSAEDADFSRAASETVALQESTVTETLAIGVKSTSLMSMLQAAAKTENVVIELRDPSTAILLKPEDMTASTTALCMPMLLNQ